MLITIILIYNIHCEYSRKMNSLTLDDTVKLFKLATKDELSYYYTIHVLQQVIQISIWNLNKNICEK